jgi:hypothetical protein
LEFAQADSRNVSEWGKAALQEDMGAGAILFLVFMGLSIHAPNGHKIHRGIPETSIE